MNRVTQKKVKQPKVKPDPSSESEVTASDSEIESEFEIEIKDVHRQKSLPSRPRKVKAQQDSQNVDKGDEPAVAKTTIAPSMSFLVALAYRQGTSAVQFDARSYYVPDCASLFSAAYYICELLVPNSLVHELDPAFVSLSFYLYVGHLFYYHILRVRDSVGELTREERRCLRHYENIGPSEAWPVPTPLVGILQSYGNVDPPSKYYGKIIPRLPSFLNFTPQQSLVGIEKVTSISRVPIIPALQEFCYNFGAQLAQFNNLDGLLYPTGSVELTPGAAGPPTVPANRFVGLFDSAINGSGQVLFHSNGWFRPAETPEGMINFPHAQKRALIARMDIPRIGDTASITGIESFLGFRDDQSNAWMRQLLRCGSTVCRFFPDSSNLSAIGTTTQEEMISIVYWSSNQVTSVTNKWYDNNPPLRTYSISGHVNTERSGLLYKAAASASPNSSLDPTLFPIIFPPQLRTADRSGPYFVNKVGTTSIPLSLVEIVSQPDPIRNMLSFMDEHLYDNLGGRSRS